MPLAEGMILENRYRIRGVLGEGGMSRVYLADDLRLKIQVALKENLQTSDESHRQFTQEAEMLARLSHPNLPRVIDFFTSHETGKQYFVMDYIAGEDLDKLVKRVGPLNEATALNWIGQILGALEYLHSQTPPIIHRDVKPSNIKITPDGKAVLVDFGIAKIYDGRGGTMTGARAVTPGYAAPEQYGLRTDPRSDIYSLGATLYTMLTGRVPPEAPLRMSDAEKLVSPRELNPSLSTNLENVLLRAMELSTTKRLQSVSQLRTALEGRAVASPTASEAKTVFVPRRSSTNESKQTVPLWLIPTLAGALLLIVGGILFMTLLVGNNSTQVAVVTATPTHISIPPTATRTGGITATRVVNDAIPLAPGKRRVILELEGNNNATLTTQEGGKASLIQKGKWQYASASNEITVKLTDINGRPFEDDIVVRVFGSDFSVISYNKALHGDLSGLELVHSASPPEETATPIAITATPIFITATPGPGTSSVLEGRGQLNDQQQLPSSDFGEDLLLLSGGVVLLSIVLPFGARVACETRVFRYF